MDARNTFINFDRPTFDESNFFDEADIYRLFENSAEFLRMGYGLRSYEIEQAEDSLVMQLTNREWRENDFYTGIDFEDLRMCCAYLRRYATCHACLVRHVTKYYLRLQPYCIVSRLINGMVSLKIVSAGGGPGNDLIGFCNALVESTTGLRQLDLTVVDLKGGWRKVFNEIMYNSVNHWAGKVSNLFTNVDLNYKFVKNDLCTSSTFEVQEADLILMVKLLSNVSFMQKMAILHTIFSSMKPGAIFFFIDIDAEIVVAKSKEYFMKLLELESRQTFTHSITDSLKTIFTSTYEVCILQKMTPMPIFY